MKKILVTNDDGVRSEGLTALAAALAAASLALIPSGLFPGGDEPHYLILNTAIGGAWGGQKGIDDTIFPQKFLIDYVRVYQKAD